VEEGHAAELYVQNKLTLERASKEAGVSVREMIEYFKSKKIQAQYDLEDLEEDMKNFYKRTGK
jgi:predicted HTH domain antitoxin